MSDFIEIEPSDAERAELPEQSAAYMESLEAEVERLKEANGRYAGAIASLTDDHGKLLAQCNTLRSALGDLKAISYRLPGCDDPDCIPCLENSRALDKARQALSQTPEQSLETYKDEVLEEAAKVAEKRYEEWKKYEPDYHEVDDDVSACKEIAKAIRAMKTKGG